MKNPFLVIATICICFQMQGQNTQEEVRRKIISKIYDVDIKKVIDFDKIKSQISNYRKINNISESIEDKKIINSICNNAWPPNQNSVLISKDYWGIWDYSENLVINKDYTFLLIATNNRMGIEFKVLGKVSIESKSRTKVKILSASFIVNKPSSTQLQTN